MHISNYLLYILEASLPVKGAYWISSNPSVIQYCDSNIGLFSIALPLVIALPTLRKNVVALTRS